MTDEQRLADSPLPRRVQYSDKRKAYNREFAKKSRAERKKANLCPDCGKPKDGDSYRCSTCKDRQKAEQSAARQRINEQGRKRRNAHNAAGLCTLCSEPAAPGYTKCLKHVESSRQKRTAFHKKMIAESKCIQCAKPVVPGSLLCEQHLNKREATKDRYQDTIAAGLCTRCRTSPATEGRRLCEECHSKAATVNRKRIDDYLAQNRCTACGETSLPSAIRCRVCYLKSVASQNGLTSAGWVVLDAAWKRQNGLCAYSGEPLELGRNASVDHILPVARGGASVESNVQWVSRVVNDMKGNLLESEFIHLVRCIARHFTPDTSG